MGQKSKTFGLIVILFVSAAAFGAGYLQNIYQGQADVARKLATEYQHQADQMEAQADFFIGFD